MPNSDYIAISKKISDESERERLNRLLEDIKPEGVGVIIRTAAKDKDEKDFEKEIEYLIKKWQEVENKIDKAKIGEVIYKDSNLIKRICRDAFSSDIDELIINSEEKHWELIDYISAFGDPELKTKVKLHRREEKIFDYYGVNEEIENALKKRVWLKCGGYLIIEKTEALISIDVNTGKNIGSSNLEETVFETNLEAAAEIPRQLRLRNLGGIIIIDFIDMNLEEDKDQVLEVLEENLSQDRIRSNIVRFSELGLVEMTRKRVGKELSTFFLESCKNCNGSGVVEAKEVIVYKIIKEIMNHADEEGVVKFEVNVHNDIKEILEDDYLLYIENYLQNCKKKVEFYTKNLYNRNEYKILLVEDED